LAAKVCVLLPPTSFISACTLTPSAVTVDVPIRASFCMSAMLIAIAIPTAVSELPFAAEPSAIADASMLFSAFRLSAPVPRPSPATIVSPLPIAAVAWLDATFSASAAPTLTESPPPLPSSVEAFLSTELLLPETVLARSVCFLPCWSASALPSLPLSAPAADALAVEVDEPSVRAVKVMFLLAVRFCSVVARPVSLMKPSAIAAPTAVSGPPAAASAVVVLTPLWAATRSIPPVAPSSDSPAVPITASVMLSTTEMASVPPSPVPSFDSPPPIALVWAICVPLALRPRSSIPVSVAPSPIRALVRLSTTLIAIDSPAPKSPPEFLSVFGVASAIDFVALVAEITRSAPCKSTVAPSATKAATLVEVTFSAKPPATPVSLPLAPEIADAVKVLPPCSIAESVTVTASISAPLPR